MWTVNVIIKGSVPTAACRKADCQASVAAGQAGWGETSGEQESTFREPTQYRFTAKCDTFADTGQVRSHPLLSASDHLVNKNEHPTVNGD